MSTSPGLPSRRVNWMRDAFVGLLLLTIALLGAGVYLTERYSVMTGSMEPTLNIGETVWAVRTFEPPERGAVVSFVNPTAAGASEILIKRVVGLPGERIEAIDGVVYINSAALNGSAWVTARSITDDFGPIEIGQDHYFLLGDNREHSIDSRTFGAVPGRLISYEVRP